MAESEIASMLEALAADTHRCAPVTASVIRRRGDRRRVAVRAMASASTVALVGATAGTAYAVDHGSGRASLHTGTMAAGHHPSPRPVPAPVPATRHERVLVHKLHVAHKRLHHERADRVRLHAAHRAGDIGDTHFQQRLAQLNNRIAATREHIASLRARLDHALAQSAAARPAVAPNAATGRGTVQCQDATSPGSAAPTPVPSPTPTSVTCDTESGPGTAVPTPSPSPTSK
jgi:hypothetical protein